MAADPWSQLFCINIFYIIQFNVSKNDVHKLLKYFFLLNNIHSKKTKTETVYYLLYYVTSPLRVVTASPPRVCIIFLIIQQPIVNYSLLDKAAVRKLLLKNQIMFSYHAQFILSRFYPFISCVIAFIFSVTSNRCCVCEHSCLSTSINGSAWSWTHSVPNIIVSVWSQ